MNLPFHITTLNWDDATPLGYDEALERLVREFEDEPVSVDVYGANGVLQTSFVSRLGSVSSYDGEMPHATVALEFEGAGEDARVSVVLDRGEFREAAWLEQPGPLRPIERAVRFSIDDRQIEFTHP